MSQPHGNILAHPQSQPWIAVAPYFILIAAVFLFYSNSFAGAFLYDDNTLIVGNQFLRSWHYLPNLFTSTITAGDNIDGAYYRPMQMLVYMITYHIAGLSLSAFHLLNISLHAINAALVYRLGLKLGFKPMAVFAGALLWALHPLHTEVAAYMSGTADPLSTAFCLLGMLMLFPDFAPRRIWAAMPFLILALLSKEEAVVFPLLAASGLYYLSKGRFILKTYLRLWPLVAVTALFIAIHYTLPLHGLPPAIYVKPSLPASQHLSYVPFAALPLYVRWLLWPTGLHMEHDLMPITSIAHFSVIAGFVIIVATVLQIIKPQIPRSLPLSWGLFWFGAALLPVFDTESIVYEHWLYMPSIGLMLAVPQMIALYIEPVPAATTQRVGTVLLALTLCVAMLLGVLTYRQTTVWHDDYSLYTNTINHETQAVKAHANLGGYYTLHHDYADAMQQYQLAIDQSHDTIPDVQNNMAITLLMMPGGNHDDEALAHFKRALEIDPNYFPTLHALANYYTSHGDAAQAALYREKTDAINRANKTTPTNNIPPS